jgi:hypothetical protein
MPEISLMIELEMLETSAETLPETEIVGLIGAESMIEVATMTAVETTQITTETETAIATMADIPLVTAEIILANGKIGIETVAAGTITTSVEIGTVAATPIDTTRTTGVRARISWAMVRHLVVT